MPDALDDVDPTRLVGVDGHTVPERPPPPAPNFAPPLELEPGWKREPAPPPPAPPKPRPRLGGIRAPHPTPVTIDGRRAGDTPLTLARPASSQPIVINGQTVIPDRDQTVELR